MAEPNPIWGLHLAPGALAGALVRRTDSGHEILETFVETAPSDAAGLRATAAAVLGRKGLRGRAALVAAADHECTVRTGQIPSEELYLNDEEIFHQLHDFAPFEPGEGHLTYISAGKPDARRFLLAGIPVEAHATIEDLAESLDGRFHGIGLATSCLFAGARALGLVGRRGYVVAVHARHTVILAIDDEKLRRYLLPVGIEQCEADLATSGLLGEDILRTTAYHVEQARREEPAAESADIVFAGPTAETARRLIGPALGGRLSATAARPGESSDVRAAEGKRFADADALACAGAIGAAVEAFRPAESRLVLRHPPADVPEYQETGSAGWLKVAVGLLVVAGLGAAAWKAMPEGPETIVKETVIRENSGPAPTIDPGDSTELARIAHEALLDLASREAALRCAVAAALVQHAANPPHRARSLSIEAGSSTMRFTVHLDVDGTITPKVRREARAALEGFPGFEILNVDVSDGALRVRARCGVDSPPEATEGDRLVEPRILRNADGRFDLESTTAGNEPRDVARRLIESSGETPVALRPDELEYATALTSNIVALELLLPSAPTGPTFGPAAIDAGGVRQGLEAPLIGPATVERRALPDGDWETVLELEKGATQFEDHVPGPSGAYAWRIVSADGTANEPIEHEIDVPVDITCAGLDMTTGTATFELTRPFAGASVSLRTTIRVGAPIQGVDADSGVHFEPGLTLTGITERSETEATTVHVPQFQPDGRIERDERGSPVLDERPGERRIRVFDVTAEDAEGEATTWVRKMTDG